MLPSSWLLHAGTAAGGERSKRIFRGESAVKITHARNRVIQLVCFLLLATGITGCSQSVSEAPPAARAAPAAPQAKPRKAVPQPQAEPDRSEDVTERDQDRRPSEWKRKLRALYA